MNAQPTAGGSRRTRAAIAILVLAVFVVAAWNFWPSSGSGSSLGTVGDWQTREGLSTLRGRSMGTTYQVTVANIAASQLHALQGIVQRELELVDQRMSTWREDSELSELNRHPAGQPMRVSSELFEVITEAARIHELTAGAFDVTVGPLVKAWGFGAGAHERDKMPEVEEITQIAEHVGMDKLGREPTTRALTRATEGVYCDLSAIAKGYAVDRVADGLIDADVADFMVEVGGEIRASGQPTSERAWRVGIERPAQSPAAGERGIQEVVELRDIGMATSGDYRNYFELDGKRISHTIDPRARRPITHNLASVTVFHPSAMTADAWATGLTVLGPQLGMRVAEANKLAVHMLLREERGFVTHVSSAYAQLASSKVSDLDKAGTQP